MGKLSRAAGGISRLVFGDNADGGSGAQGVEQLIQFVRNRLHVGLGGRSENRQAQRRDGDEARTEVVEVVLDGLELAGHFARGQRALPSTGWGVAKNHTRYAHRHRY